ncbi:MAG TPA: PA14 domain-containing protein [Puia sp.]|nr:PA14 domain-containing protein [Puia sp.]
MIIQFLSRHTKAIAWSFYFLFCSECLSAAHIHEGPPYRSYLPIGEDRPLMSILPGKTADVKTPKIRRTFGGGPTQPEMQAFQSVNANNMVDLFSGDFSYNIPLMDVGGYPLSLSYRSGVSMDQEASWVGLGWNINPGTITRNLRGLPDDFSGKDSIKKITSIKEDKTVGLTGGFSGDVEVAGFPINVNFGANLGVFHNNYKGWGIENGINASINSGQGGKGTLTAGMGLTVSNNSQDGLTLSPSLSLELQQHNEEENSSISGSLSISAPYNSRSGLKGLELTIGDRQSKIDNDNQAAHNVSGSFTSEISFAHMAYTPTITMPMTNRNYSFTAKLGLAEYVFHPSFYLTGYISKHGIDQPDTALALPAYGYLHYQDGANNKSALLDMNREKELTYTESPAMPHIAVPFYTYDAFSITGEGTGGMFRAYRGDIGYVYDHFIRTKDNSDKTSVDLGVSSLVHGGIDLNVTRAFTQNSAWTGENTMANVVHFKQDSGLFEAAYFRNPGEKSINSKKFYDNLGGDDVVTTKLFQGGISSSVIQGTNYLTLYRNKRPIADSLMTAQKAFKPERDKRTQVISYLNAEEADAAGLNKYIENYAPNVFVLNGCRPVKQNDGGFNTGLVGEYYRTKDFTGTPIVIPNDSINYNWFTHRPPRMPDTFPANNFSVRWTGRFKSPVTGPVIFTIEHDDGIRFWMNDSLLLSNYKANTQQSDTVNLVAGEYYPIKIEYYQVINADFAILRCDYAGHTGHQVLSRECLYPPAIDTFPVSDYMVQEKRVNSFRKSNHISEIDVLNNDGRRYVYGIPVYNLRQKEATFSVDKNNGNATTGLVRYTHDTLNADNTANGNHRGKDWYYNSEEIPAYAHSFLLTGILSPDYVDLTGNGISDDDRGDAVKFNYSKICGIGHPYQWRAPYTRDSATYNDGLKTDNRDDKGNYVYGEKELWYLHSIESKTMIATFVTENRADLFPIDENGHIKGDSLGKRLKEINLYSKADFIKNGTAAIPVKTVHFEYSYELCPGANQDTVQSHGKLTLKKVWFTYNGNDKGKQNPYIFNYNALNPRYNIRSYDRWGNYKDPSQNPTTGSTVTNAEYPYSLQDSTLAAKNAAAWALDSIYLPSGGAIKVSYESDDYAYVQHRRAMNMFKLAGLGPDTLMAHSSNKLYTPNLLNGDNLYVFVNVPRAVTSKADLYEKYLSGVSKLYFKLYVRMPDDIYGSGSEYVPCYADLEQGNSYGIVNGGVIWVKISGISLAGDDTGPYSPLAKAAIQYLRLNLPSKAYPGSEIGDDLDLSGAVKMVFSLADNIRTAFESFDKTARGKPWCTDVDLNRTFIRLDNPYYKKYGGGHRVKRIAIYDNWDKMTQQRAAVYGQDYTYTTQQEINGVMTTISSGVASYEPGIGGEENPFRQPIEYVEKIAPLGPVTLGYSEEPLGESIFPGASIGYSKVRVRTINYKNRKSANGYEETTFYTAYDFPTFTDRTVLDNDTKKRYKPALANFLRINAYHYLTFSQGFKVELNDMHGKMRSQAFYPETDPVHYTSYTENVYKVEDPTADEKKLSNVVSVMHPDGTIDTAAYIGKDVELMMDMREQLSITNGFNISPNIDMFSMPFPPIWILPSAINLSQREENRFRSTATLKVIQRYGILDSVIHIDKGSKVSTKDILYDSETGDVLLTRTQNEFNDPVYSFSYPSHWAYDGMGLAYKNIDLLLKHVFIRNGKIVSGSPLPDSSLYTLFASGDEILAAGKLQTGSSDCAPVPATFADYTRIWAIDSSVLSGGPRRVYFIDGSGQPFTGNDATLKVIRSGRRNMNTMVGAVTCLQNPLVRDSATGGYKLSLTTASQVVNASAGEFKQLWKVEDLKLHHTSVNCVDSIPYDCSGSGTSCTCQCLRSLFGYLIASRRLFIKASDGVSVSSLVSSANSAGYSLSVNDCPVLQVNKDKLFYALTKDSISSAYTARIGDFVVSWNNAKSQNLYHFYPETCGGGRVLPFRDTVDAARPDTVSKTMFMTHTMTVYDLDDDPVNDPFGFTLPHQGVDSPAQRIMSYAKSGNVKLGEPNSDIYTYVKFDSISNIPSNATINSANLFLFAAPHGFYPPGFPNAHTTADSVFYIDVPITTWNTTTTYTGANKYYKYGITSISQNLTMNVTSAVQSWINSGNRGFMFTATSYDTLKYSSFVAPLSGILFNLPYLNVTYTVPANSDTISGYMLIHYNPTCDTLIDYSCNSVVTDTSMNPYTTGVLGNWRGNRSYTYYGARAETDPTSQTNIRHNGAFHDFAPYWAFQGKTLQPQPDTTRWVWNSELTLFNPKGMELENKDPLGRYNSILYGYYNTLPVAVIQNGHYRESAFEGFEDYGFVTQTCDTACPAARHIDFGPYLGKLSTAQKHSGKSSLLLDGHDQVGLSFPLISQDTAQPTLNFITTTDACPGVGAVLSAVKTPHTILLPTFSPFKGRKMVVSIWVKEKDACNCTSYVNCAIKIECFGATASSSTFTPSGPIIEGWQRCEGVFTIPADDTALSVNMESTGSTQVYFDDLRIHPFNANMKSFVYSPVNLRLMAEQDENNYSTFYEYDDDGTLIRVKKETERGIQTIKETRSALLKQQP